MMKNLTDADIIDVNNYRKKPRSELGGLSLTDINQLNRTNKINLMNYANVIQGLEKINKSNNID